MSRSTHSTRTTRRLPSATPGRHGSDRTTLRGLIGQGRLDQLENITVAPVRPRNTRQG